MEKLTSLNLSFDRILIQILIPGLISIFPYFLLYLNFHPNAKSYLLQNQSVTITSVSFLSLIAGMILENLSGRFEVLYLDKLNRKRDSDFDSIWENFLKITYEKGEPVGHRYLRSIILRMKFEISAGIALIPMFIGLLILNFYKPIFDYWYWVVILLIIAPLGFSAYLLFCEARSSSRVLANTRKLLVGKYFSLN